MLRAEVDKLKQLNSASVGDDVISESRREIAWLRQHLMTKEVEMNEMKRFVFIIYVYIVVVVIIVSSFAWNGYMDQTFFDKR